jgi:hypothetical protein
MDHTRVQKALLATLRATLRHIRRECNVRSALPPPPAPGAAPAAAAAPAPKDVSHFTGFVLSEYRKGAAVKDRARVRQLRAHASDILSYFQATAQQNVRPPRPRPCHPPPVLWASRQALPGQGPAHCPLLAFFHSRSASRATPTPCPPPLASPPPPPTQALLALQRGSDPDKEMARSAAARYVGLSIPEGVPLGLPTAPAKYSDTVTARLSGRLEDTALEGVDFLKAQYYGARSVLEEKRTK